MWQSECRFWVLYKPSPPSFTPGSLPRCTGPAFSTSGPVSLCPAFECMLCCFVCVVEAALEAGIRLIEVLAGFNPCGPGGQRGPFPALPRTGHLQGLLSCLHLFEGTSRSLGILSIYTAHHHPGHLAPTRLPGLRAADNGYFIYAHTGWGSTPERHRGLTVSLELQEGYSSVPSFSKLFLGSSWCGRRSRH